MDIVSFFYSEVQRIIEEEIWVSSWAKSKVKMTRTSFSLYNSKQRRPVAISGESTIFNGSNTHRMGKAKGYEGLFTTNCNKLTQHIAKLLQYQVYLNTNV
jgi:hypothetical protein